MPDPLDWGPSLQQLADRAGIELRLPEPHEPVHNEFLSMQLYWPALGSAQQD